MARIPVEVTEATLQNDSGNSVDGIVVTCSECGEQVECFGTSEKSVKRACILLREACPDESNNFYFDPGSDDD